MKDTQLHVNRKLVAIQRSVVFLFLVN